MSTSPAVATRRLPGVEGVWVFVLADMCFFGVLFVSFMQERIKQGALFETARHTLNPDFGGINTLILLTSSWLVVLAVDAANRDRIAAIPKLLLAAMLCGIAFGISKAIEYGGKLAAGITPMSNDFYMFYFSLTGIHLLHVIGGCVMLTVFWLKARRGEFDSRNMKVLESGATYWHMVDLLWIFLFPLLYLLR
ncbi:cytochrome c oxidase subunit 3 family protein [uncultured Nevskia sp.]|uniref:cytochrome c oxidase subunit 3 family protein n=1 Tax=uncultured Nevskia sp. TaxID=228950 RepID=UPI0025ECAA10|nr:cytochrome c oxidase subunit 3 family protein [uncultured Nevskia sp.]